MAIVTELLGYIGLDVDDASFNEAEQSVQDVTKVMAGLVTIAASVATAVTGAAYAMVNDFANTATELDQLTKRLNVNAEAFQATAYAAKSYGIEQDQLADGMKELSMRAGEFALTGEGSFKDVAAQLGLSREQVKSYGNDVNGLFDLVRDKLAGIQNQGQRQFLADALFGGGLADVGGEFFSQTSANIEALQKQAQESGLVISQETIDMAREYTREMDSLQARIKGLWNIVASNLLPVFTRITRQMKEFFDLHGDDIVDGLTSAINGLITAIKYLGVAAAITSAYMLGSAALASWASLIKLIGMARNGMLLLAAAEVLVNALNPGFLLAVGIGLAIAAITVLLQDLYTYFTGGDSITGRIVAGFTKALGSVKKLFTEFGNWFHEWFSGFIASTTEWMGDVDKKVAQMGQPIVDKIKLAWAGLKAWFIDWAKSVGNELANFIPDWLKDPMSLLPDWVRPDDSGSDDQQPAQRSAATPGEDGESPFVSGLRSQYSQREQREENRAAESPPARGEERRNVESPAVRIEEKRRIESPPGIHQLIIPGNAPGAAPVPTVMSPPTMAQGIAQANSGRGDVITTNSGNTTVGEIIVNGAENPAATAQAIRQELRRDNASRTKGSDTGVKY